MALSPKELLMRDEYQIPLVADPKPSFSSGSSPQKLATSPGKQGFLWREVDPAFSQDIETYHKVWVVIVGHNLLFSEPVASSVNENQFIVENCGNRCTGYMSLENAEVRIRNIDKSVKRAGFLLKDGYAQLTFFAETDAVRDSWMEIIREGIRGCEMVIQGIITMPAAPTVQVEATVDFPHKQGFLKKTSSGSSTFGLKSIKKRWFRLEAGELRYYEDEDVRASKLKGVLQLQGAKIATGDGSQSGMINLFLSSGRNMRLEASTPKEALEWRDAFTATVGLLDKRGNTREVAVRAKRRFNLHDRLPPQRVAQTPPPPASPAAATSPMLRTRTISMSLGFGNDSPPPPPISSPASPSSSPFARLLSRASSVSALPTPPAFVTIPIVIPTFKTPAVFDMLKSVLVDHFLLKHLKDLGPVVEAMTPLLVCAGEVVVWQGSSGDLFYIIEIGQMEIIKDLKSIGHVFAGKSFGEMALLSNAVRQASIRAVSSTKLWCLSRQVLRDIAISQEAALLAEKVSFLKTIDLFKDLLDSGLEKIAEVMDWKEFPINERIIRQGDAGDRMYMIAFGRVVVTQTTLLGATTELVKLGPNKAFGELALIDNSPRKATVTTLTSVGLWSLERVPFCQLFGSIQTAVQESIGIKMLKRVQILANLNEPQLISLSHKLVKRVFAEGEVIIKQGDIGDAFYMISSGSVNIIVNHIQVAVLENDSFFGEMSLLNNEKRSATVSARTDTECLILNRKDFDELLGPLEGIIAASVKRKSDLEERSRRKSTSGLLMNQLKHFSGVFSNAPATSPTQGTSSSNLFELDQLDRLRKIAQGSFASVYLVQHYFTNKHYVMKVIPKEGLRRSNTEVSSLREKEALHLLADSSYAPALYATLQDAKCIYFVQQYLSGGDLWSLLYGQRLSTTKCGGISPQNALFYFANILAAVDFMHSLGVVHRDLKPENILIDSNGYCKLTDFGTTVSISSTRTRSLVGCAEYICPEMIFYKLYGYSVDFWSLGVLLFELLTRSTPFFHANLSMLFQNVIDCEETMKTFFTNNLLFDAHIKQLITGLLVFNPNKRLGLLHNGIADIWQSAFMKGVTKDMIEKRTLTAPYIPISEEDSLDSIEVPEDDTEDVPVYTGCFDYSLF